LDGIDLEGVSFDEREETIKDRRYSVFTAEFSYSRDASSPK